MGEYQQRYFGDRQITIISEVIGNTNLKPPRVLFPHPAEWLCHKRFFGVDEV
jgi:hypothetical protein